MDSRAALLTLARYAQGQWGMVTSAQAIASGVNYMQLKRMADAELLEKVGPGVYLLIGGQAALGRHQAHKVAWLRLDPGVAAWERAPLGANNGVVSHRSAAVLLRLGDLVVRDVEFTTPRRRTSRDSGVRMHQATLASYEVAWEDGLPVTTAIRTLADLLAAGIAPATPAASCPKRWIDGCSTSITRSRRSHPSRLATAARRTTASRWSSDCSTVRPRDRTP